MLEEKFIESFGLGRCWRFGEGALWKFGVGFGLRLYGVRISIFLVSGFSRNLV